jgi:ArsR family transcriptional regulator
VEAIARADRHPPRNEGECGVVCVDGAKVASARASAPDADALQAVADRFGALSDPTRLRILHALMRAELCVCDLANVAGRSLPATSQQLKLLRNLGLVRFRTEGKLSYYSLSGEWVRSVLADALAEASVAP